MSGELSGVDLARVALSNISPILPDQPAYWPLRTALTWRDDAHVRAGP
ncbi:MULTISPECIES: hypothetical protein [unclassified Streptomyces]